MHNITRISTSKNYLGLSKGFYPNNLIFIRNVEANRACLVVNELPISSVNNNSLTSSLYGVQTCYDTSGVILALVCRLLHPHDPICHDCFVTLVLLIISYCMAC
jgi:hypothetical protein